MTTKITQTFGAKTAERVKKFGKYGDSFDDILKRMVDHCEKCKGYKK